jgi:hypothetical protein
MEGASPEAVRNSLDVGKAGWIMVQIAAFALTLAVTWQTMEPWYENTSYYIEQTTEAWKTVEPNTRRPCAIFAVSIQA